MTDAGTPLPYGRQSIDEADVDAVVEALRSDFLTQGPRVAAFEEALRGATGAPFACAMSNGTVALHAAYAALGLGPGDAAIVPAITFVATANAARYVGADVFFCDVEADTGLLDVESATEVAEGLAAGGRPPKLFAPVHMAGQPADVSAVKGLADRFGASVVEDAAHALGASVRDGSATRRVGECHASDAATLSFHPVKHVTTGEGGAVLCRSAELHAKLEELRSHGIHKDPRRLERAADDPFVGPWYYEMPTVGWNYRITDLQCALGISQVAKLDGFLARRRALAARYDAALGKAPLSGAIRPIRSHEHRTSAYHLYVVQVVAQQGETPRDVAARRKDLFAFLREHRIFAQVHYVPVPWQPYYRALGAPQSLPGAEAYYAACLSLPLFPAMRDGDVDRVVERLAVWVGRS